MMILWRFPTLRAIVLMLIVAGLPAAQVLGADIALGGSCSLADAITSANATARPMAVPPAAAPIPSPSAPISR